ncbi:MAG: ketoacyl-ACP synthase III [Proteobacteria bacterium]|nr:ketoacyl-ACP synthase III [Pseudomonadota bacterium]
MQAIRIAGVGRAVPERVLTNAELERMVDTTDQWIVERTGIRERRILPDDQATSDLAAAAARAACQQAELPVERLDALIVATITPDTQAPSTAVHLQHKLGLSQIPAFDISAACAGFVYGLGIAEAMLKAGRYGRVLVVGAEILSRVTDWTDRSTCVLFGDGAGAAVLTRAEPGQGQRLVDVSLGADGAHASQLEIPGGGSREPASLATIERRRHFVRMNGRQVFTQAVKSMSAAATTVLERNGRTTAEVDLVFAHQANMRIIEGISQRTGIPLERFFNNIEKYGNTSSASVPIAMSEAVEHGRLKRGDLVLLTALGAGVAWGSALLEW